MIRKDLAVKRPGGAVPPMNPGFSAFFQEFIGGRGPLRYWCNPGGRPLRPVSLPLPFPFPCLGTREACLGTREACLGPREASLGPREASLGPREASVEAREAAVEAKK